VGDTAIGLETSSAAKLISSLIRESKGAQMSGKDTICIQSSADAPTRTVNRQLGEENLGVYCKNRACLEFSSVALGPFPSGMEVMPAPPEDAVFIRCWSCQQTDRYQSYDFEIVRLTETNKRRRASD